VRRALALIAVAALAGCLTPPPPAENDLAHAAATPPPVAAAPTPTAPAAPSPATMAEVEFGGTVTLPPKVKGDVTVWVVDAPCWQPGGRAFIATKVTGNKFFSEVFVPQGTQLWMCAAVGNGDKPLEIYGQADRAPVLGKGTGEVTFFGLSIKLAKGKKVAAPARR
jgi:hypothetical protein